MNISYYGESEKQISNINYAAVNMLVSKWVIFKRFSEWNNHENIFETNSTVVDSNWFKSMIGCQVSLFVPTFLEYKNMCILSEHVRWGCFEKQANECAFSQKEQTLTKKGQTF